MKITTSELIENLEVFKNGCAFRLVTEKKGLVIKTGCYNLASLATGSHRYLNELLSGKSDLKLTKDFLDESPTITKNKAMKEYQMCKWCEKLHAEKRSNHVFKELCK